MKYPWYKGFSLTTSIILLSGCSSPTASTPDTSSNVAFTAPSSTTEISTTPMRSDPTTAIQTASSETTGTTAPATTNSPDVDVTGTEPNIPAGLSPEDQEAAQTALDIFAAAVQQADELQSNPGAQDWTEQVYQYRADPGAAEILAGLQRMAADKVHQTGRTKFRAWVTSVSPETILLTACLDQSDVEILDESGEVITNKTPLIAGYTRYIVMNKYPNLGWLVSESNRPDPGLPC